MCSSFLDYHTLGNDITLFIVTSVNESKYELSHILIDIDWPYILSIYVFYKLSYLILQCMWEENFH